MNWIRKHAILPTMLLALTSIPLQAAVRIYDNTQDGAVEGIQAHPEYAYFAQPFKMGASGLDKLTSVTLSMSRMGKSRGTSIEVQVWKADSLGQPDEAVRTLGKVSFGDLDTTPSLVTLNGTATGLDPSATYFIVLKLPGTRLNSSNALYVGSETDPQGTRGAGYAWVQGAGQTQWSPLLDAQGNEVHLQMSLLAGGRGQTVETFISSPGLSVNKVNDAATRRAMVYLPPGYDHTDKRYPVLYILHGTGGHENAYGGARTEAESLINSGQIADVIIVHIDSSTAYSVSFYTNAEGHGYHEDYIVRHIVDHIDASYRTIPDRNSRGAWGHSTGGYGVLLYGMKYSHIFGAIYSASGGGFCWSLPECVLDLSGDTVKFSTELQSMFGTNFNISQSLVSVPEISSISGTIPNEMYSMAAAFSPNLTNPPLYVDMPWDLRTLEINPEVRDRWYEHDLFYLLPDHIDDLLSLRGIGVGIGKGDQIGLYAENEILHQLMVEAGIPHQFDVDGGGHGPNAERYQTMLLFFSETLLSGAGGLSETPNVQRDQRLIAHAGEDVAVTLPNDEESVLVVLNAAETQVGSADIVSYDWSIGEQFLGEGLTLEVALPAGRHVCYLVVTDAEGRQDVADVIVYVHRRGLPESQNGEPSAEASRGNG